MAIGIVGYAHTEPTDVMPWHLARAFRRMEKWTILSNEYANGESQRRSLVETGRNTWELDNLLIADNLTELREYYRAHRGGWKPFIFYDVSEAFPKFAYDLTANSLDGKFVVRFDGPFEQTVSRGTLCGSVATRLIELAPEPGE